MDKIELYSTERVVTKESAMRMRMRMDVNRTLISEFSLCYGVWTNVVKAAQVSTTLYRLQIIDTQCRLHDLLSL